MRELTEEEKKKYGIIQTKIREKSGIKDSYSYGNYPLQKETGVKIEIMTK